MKDRGRGWFKSALVNGVGAVVTGIVLVIIAVEKFEHGAWMVLLAIPGLVLLTKKIHQHYLSIAEQLSLQCVNEVKEYEHHSVIVPISGMQQAV